MQGYWRGLPFTSPGNLSSPGSILLHCICGMHGGLWYLAFSSVQFSRSVVSDPLRPHELQHARPPCPSPSPGVNPKLMCIKSVMPSSHLIFCHSLLLLPPNPPRIRAFSNESTLRSVTSLSLFTFMHWRRKWQPTPVFLPGESQEWWSLVGCRLWGRTESDTTEAI